MAPVLPARRVSTHAPRVHEERPPPGPAFSEHSRFNPRSSRSRGATSDGAPTGPCRCFNPRSSRSRGATIYSLTEPPGRMFQPTLLAFTRSDYVGPYTGPWRFSFQPTLLAFTRSDSTLTLHGLTPLFQPTLLAFTRSDGCQASPWGMTPFQPTLLALTRSDRPDVLPQRNAEVSTHAPRVNEERRLHGRAARAYPGFNPRSSR